MTGEHRTNGDTPGAAPIRRLDHRPALWPQLSAAQARLARLLADARLPRALNLDGFDTSTTHTPKWRNPGAIELECDGSQATVFVDLDTLPALKIAASNAGSASDDEDDPLTLAIAQLLVKPALRGLARYGLDNVRVSGLRKVPVAQLQGRTFTLALALGERRMRCLLGDIGQRWLDAFEACLRGVRMSALNSVADASGVGALAAITVPTRLRLGAQACSIELLKTLRNGDVLLPTVAADAHALLADASAAITLSARWGAAGSRPLAAAVSIVGNVLTFLETPHMTDEIDQSPNDMADHENAVELEQLELPVQFELDAVSLPVALLASLRPGYVVELPTVVRDARVRLAAYGQTIGYGELVSVGEHLGVRIVHLADLHDSVQ
jgi:type III secretion protein Q